MTQTINCPNCGVNVGEADLIHFGDVQVCVLCKERYSQSIREGLDPLSAAGNTSHGYVVQHLHYGSTWKLFGLAVITLGIYSGHYILKKTTQLNQLLDTSEKISLRLAWSNLIASYLGLILGIPYFLSVVYYPEWLESVEKIDNTVSTVSIILMLVWGYKFGNRMNGLLQANKQSVKRFHGLPIFFLSPFYHNYKINKLIEKVRPGRAGVDVSQNPNGAE